MQRVKTYKCKVNMKCTQCKEELNHIEILLNTDGDFACSVTCEKAYKKEREHFYNTLIYNETAFKKWITGK